ncbi:hypothetical protein N9963_03115, partial [Crocinitomicaceae bacterium]|nr:hypothetical protein [Crocinitomicaceae bacterium]
MKKVKNLYLFVVVALTSWGSFAVSEKPINSSNWNIKEAVSVTVSLNNGGNAVKGALIKIIGERIVIGAATSDESGNATINIASYGGQLVSIEVFHRLYKNDKLKDVKLETGKTYSFTLVGKGETIEEIQEGSEAKVVKTQGEIEEEKREAEEAVIRREEAVKNQEEILKEKEEFVVQREEAKREIEQAKKEAEEARKEAEEIKNNSGSLSDEEQRQMESEMAAREKAAEERAEEAKKRAEVLGVSGVGLEKAKKEAK